MPCQEEISYVTDDVFSYMCNLAMEKCSRKTEKKKASCGGAAMRKRLLIKNFVAQMLAQERQTRDQSSGELDLEKSLVNSSSGNSSGNMELDAYNQSLEQQNEDGQEEEESELNTSTLEDEDEIEDEEQKEDNDGDEETEAAVATILAKQSNEFPSSVHHNRARLGGSSISDEEDQEQTEETSLHSSINNNVEINVSRKPLRAFSINGSFDGWRSPKRIAGAVREEEDDFHKVPIPSHQDNSDNGLQSDFLTEEEAISSMRVSEDSLLNYAPWRYYDDYGTIHDQQHHHFGDVENILVEEQQLSLKAADCQQKKMAYEDDDSQLFLLGRVDEQPERQQLIGMVNMMPSTDNVKFNFDSTDMDSSNFERQQLFYTSIYSANQLETSMDLLTASSGRKRPCLVFDDDDIQMASESVCQHQLLSPLCCGLLQMQPFGPIQPNIGVATQPLMKRVKL